MNSKHVFLDSKKRGKVNRLVQTFSTCSFLAPVSPGRVPPADPKRAAPPDSPLLCSSKDSPSPLALFWQGHPDSLHSVAPLGHLPPPHFWLRALLWPIAPSICLNLPHFSKKRTLFWFFYKCFSSFVISAVQAWLPSLLLKPGCYIWQMFRNATVTILPTAGRAPNDGLARLRCTAITAFSTLCTLLNTNSVLCTLLNTNSVLRKHRRRGTRRNIWNTSFTLRKSGKSQVWVEPKETQPRLIWHQTQGLKHWNTPLFSFIFGPFHRNENWYHSNTIIVIRQISFG